MKSCALRTPAAPGGRLRGGLWGVLAVLLVFGLGVAALADDDRADTAPLARDAGAFAAPLSPGEPRGETALPRVTATPDLESPGVMARLLAVQYQLQQTLNQRIRALHQRAGPEAAWLLIVASFGYGVMHAAGPGHGKLVIGSYLLSHPGRLRAGLLLSLAASLLQALTAVLLVFGLIHLAGLLGRDALAQVATAELFSFVLVAGLGAALSLRAARRLFAGRAGASVAPHGHAPAGEPCCGHAHHVGPETEGRWPMIATVLAVGSRPCTGAVLVLVGTHLLGLWVAGVVAVVAMALGTALAISVLAALAVHARGLALTIAARRFGGPAGLRRLADALALLGGLLIFAVGVLFVLGALVTQTPLLYRL
jgi:nickel/cobalt transporter (NicO) family protein